jgi:hypothetical protein
LAGFEQVEPREGIAMVYGPDGSYLGCIGVERWRELVEADTQFFPPCPMHGAGFICQHPEEDYADEWA